MIFSKLNSWCDVDFINFQSHSNGQFKFIMVYQDLSTKFIVVKHLEYKQIVEVIYNLINVYLYLVRSVLVSRILQSGNYKEFSNNILLISLGICLLVIRSIFFNFTDIDFFQFLVEYNTRFYRY